MTWKRQIFPSLLLEFGIKTGDWIAQNWNRSWELAELASGESMERNVSVDANSFTGRLRMNMEQLTRTSELPYDHLGNSPARRPARQANADKPSDKRRREKPRSGRKENKNKKTRPMRVCRAACLICTCTRTRRSGTFTTTADIPACTCNLYPFRPSLPLPGNSGA
jgi:hypothetical protein